MFGKIKGKLKNVFSKSEEEIFEEDEVIEEENEENSQDNIEHKDKKEDNIKDDIKDDSNDNSSEIKDVESDDVEDDNDDDNDEEIKEIEEEPQEEKQGFFSRIFKKKKDEEEIEELEELEEDLLEGVEDKEKEAIKKNKEIPDGIKEQKKEEIEEYLKKEETEEHKEYEEINNLYDKEKVPKEIDAVNKKQEENIPEIEEKDDEKTDEVEIEEKEKSSGFFSKTFGKLASKKLNEDDFTKIWADLEIFLLEINIAFEIVMKIEEKLKEAIVDNSFNRFSLKEKIRNVMVEEVTNVMIQREDDLLAQINKINDEGGIAKIVVLGVNGTGKTTSIAKFVRLLQKADKKVVVAAADTFRAAAVEQLDEHAKKVGFKLIQHKGGSDPAAVAYDAIEHAKAKKLDVVIVDTAGRMPNNSNLMQELAKIERVTQADINLFIGDSISGNDLIEQIELFDKVVGINGLILTKTDTDERPGSVVTAAFTIEKPIYYLGIGQGYDDLIKFDAKIVAENLFDFEEEE